MEHQLSGQLQELAHAERALTQNFGIHTHRCHSTCRLDESQALAYRRFRRKQYEHRLYMLCFKRETNTGYGSGQVSVSTMRMNRQVADGVN